MSLNNYQQFYELQRASLAYEFKNQMSMCLMATTAEKLFEHGSFYQWKIQCFNRIKPTSALIVQKKDKLPELWVRRDYRGYRHAFQMYLSAFYGFSDKKLPSKWVVDHMQSKHRFKKEHPLYFIRLSLIPSDINSSYGAGFEKSFYTQERKKFPYGGIHMDWFAFLKSIGFKTPGKNAGLEAWQLWAWEIALGMEKCGVENKIFAHHGISLVLNLGYRGINAALPAHRSFKKIVVNDELSGFDPAWLNACREVLT